MNARASGSRVHAPAESELDPTVQPPGVRLARLRKEDGEMPIAEVTRDIGGAHSRADLLSRWGEVDPSPLFQVENEEAQCPAVAPCAGDLPLRALLEISCVAETGELVGVGESLCLREEPRIFERRSEDPRELLELRELRVRERSLGAAPEDCEGADPLLDLSGQRNCEAPGQAELVVGGLLGRIEVPQTHRARLAA